MTSDPPNTHASAAWQLPWLRVSLILRQMARNSECRREDVAALLAMRRHIMQGGWFN
jgi:hypothetical protein